MVRKAKKNFDFTAEGRKVLDTAQIPVNVMRAMRDLPPIAVANLAPSAPPPPVQPPPTARVALSGPPPPAEARPGLQTPQAAFAPSVATINDNESALPNVAALGVAPAKYFKVYISAPRRDGFLDTSKAVEDSIKDIKRNLSKEAGVILTVINDPMQADITITVVERGIGNEAYGERTEFQAYYSGSTLEQTPMETSTFWLSTMLQAGAYRKEFTGHMDTRLGNDYGRQACHVRSVG